MRRSVNFARSRRRSHAGGGRMISCLIARETAVTASRILAELKDRLSEAYGERLHAVVLFGSEARGDARPDSDIDVMAVLDELSGDYGDELERGLAAVYPVALRIGRRVSVKPLARDEYEQGDSPLLREVRRSGVAA